MFNFLDNVRLKTSDCVTRLPLPVDDIVYLEEKVFVSMSSNSHSQLLYFQRNEGSSYIFARAVSTDFDFFYKPDLEGTWDTSNPKMIRLDLRMRLRPMTVAVSRLCFASGNSLYLLSSYTLQIEVKFSLYMTFG